MTRATSPGDAALAGIRVLELGQVIAGPFAGALLAGFGAEVVKVEAPGEGDPLRKMGKLHDGTSLFWSTLGRNKHSICIDLHEPEGQALVRDLVVRGEVDVLLENFRPGTLERWGLGWDEISAIAPRVVMVRISGYGQTGPRASEPGFANVAEAVGGLRWLSAEPGRTPVRAGVSLGDSLAGFHAAFGALVALQARERTGVGQLVDVALTESVFNVLESTFPEFAHFGHVRQPFAAALETVVPSDTYPCRGGGLVVIGANSNSMFRRLMHAIARPDLADDPRLLHNDGRIEHRKEVDEAIAEFTRVHPRDEVIERLRAAEVAAGPIQSIAEVAADEQFRYRGVFERALLPDGTPIEIPAVLPLLSATPGRTVATGPRLGAHTDDVLRTWLGLDDEAIARLRSQGTVA